MILHIKTFFDALLGATLPEVCYLIIAVALVYLVLRMFLGIFSIKTKVVDFSFYGIIVYLIISSLGGIEWTLSFL